MPIQKTALAAALLLALTACSSGSKNNNSYLESQVKDLQAKSELAQKKAEQATKRAEEAEKKAKEATNSSNKQLMEEVKELKAEALEAKKQAEIARKDAENALNNVEESVKKALDKAEKEHLEAERAQEANIKKLTRIAKQEGLVEAEYLARQHSKLTEEEFKDFLKKRKENYNALKDQALKAGLQDWQASHFAQNNQDKEKNEANEELEFLKAQIEKEKQAQLAQENKRQELIKLATDNGLEEWQAGNFAHEFQEKTLEEAKVELQKRKSEQEQKRNTLIALAQNSGLFNNQTDYEHFADNHINSDISYAESELENRKRERELENRRQTLIELAKNSGIFENEYEYERFADDYLHSDLSSARENLENRKREQLRNELYTLVNNSGLNFNYGEADNFVNQYVDLGIEAAQTEVTRRIKKQELLNLANSNYYVISDPNEFAERYLDSDISEAQAEINRLYTERDHKISELTQFAKERGLSNEDAENFAHQNNWGELEEGKSRIDDYIRNLAQGRKSIIISNIGDSTGLSTELNKKEMPLYDQNGFDTGQTKTLEYVDLYNQTYSAIAGKYTHYYTSQTIPYYNIELYTPESGEKYIGGLFTQENGLPVEGTVTYNGLAFTANKQGLFTYDVDFGLKEGQGRITGLGDIEPITLQTGRIGKRYGQSMGIAGSLSTEPTQPEAAGYGGSYVLDFFGPKAEEVTGVATLDGSYPSETLQRYGNSGGIKIGFGGSRGDIQE